MVKRGLLFSAILILLVSVGLAQAGIWDVYEGGLIPNSGDQGMSVYYFNVSNESTVNDLNVRFSASHTYDSDLDVWLISPGLNSIYINLFNNTGGDGMFFKDTYLDDQAAQSIQGLDATYAPFAGPEWGGTRYKPADSLSAFNSINPNGTWILIVNDVHKWDTGYLFKSGNIAPWGTAIGTQLIINEIVPEPASWLALGTGFMALMALRFRRR